MMEVLHIPRTHINFQEGDYYGVPYTYNAIVEVWITTAIADSEDIKLHVKAVREDAWASYSTWGSYADRITVPQGSGNAETIKAAYKMENGTVEYDFYISRDNIGQTAEVYISLLQGTFTVTEEMYFGASTVSASDGYFGGNVPISLNTLTTDAKHTLSVTCAGITTTLLEDSSSVAAVWTPTVAEYAPLITDSISAEATISCRTYIGGTEIGNNSINVSMSFQDDDESLIPSFTMSITDPTGLQERYGKLIQGQSKLTVELTPQLKYGATLQSVLINANGVKYTSNPCTTEALEKASVRARITDSRGISSYLQMANSDMYSYQAPSVSIMESYHCEQDGTRDESGQYLAVKAAATMTSLDGQNSLSISAQAKAVSGSGSFIDAGELENSIATVLNSTWSPDTSWIVRVTATDELGNSAEVSARLGTRIYAFSVKDGVTGAAIGKAAELDNVFELPAGWRIKIGDQYWPEQGGGEE